MYEPHFWRVKAKGTSMSRKLVMALGFSVAMLGGASVSMAQELNEDNLKPAVLSLKASSSLLLDVDRAGQRLVAVGSRGHIVYSDDQGESWLQAPVPVRQLLTAVDFIDDKHGWAVGHDSLILHTTDGGETWAVQYRDPEIDAPDDEGFGFLEKPLMDVWFRNAQTGFAVGAYGLMLRTDDGGQSWEDVSFTVDNEDGFHYNAIGEVSNTGLFLVGEMGTMYRSTDFGDSWETLEETPYDGSWFGVAGTGQRGGVVAWGLRGNVFRSTDFGTSWQQVELTNDRGNLVTSTLAGGQLNEDGRLILVGTGGVVAISDDQARNFNVSIRPDRVALATGISLPNGGTLLVGQRGVIKADQSGMSAAASGELLLPDVDLEE